MGRLQDGAAAVGRGPGGKLGAAGERASKAENEDEDEDEDEQGSRAARLGGGGRGNAHVTDADAPGDHSTHRQALPSCQLLLSGPPCSPRARFPRHRSLLIGGRSHLTTFEQSSCRQSETVPHPIMSAIGHLHINGTRGPSRALPVPPPTPPCTRSGAQSPRNRRNPRPEVIPDINVTGQALRWPVRSRTRCYCPFLSKQRTASSKKRPLSTLHHAVDERRFAATCVPGRARMWILAIQRPQTPSPRWIHQKDLMEPIAQGYAAWKSEARMVQSMHRHS
ncbi:hypothetical protein C8Q77DRAFT_369293 [Trametes polyzona]|nr:hypothetical protein C8Q77DRAFT_369293 [Trametes polyzona]